jgi:dihydrofolate reductase
MNPSLEMVVAYCVSNRGIGKDNRLPWNYPEDLKYFKKITSESPPEKQNVIIMGKRTWESISKPLPGRINIILSKTLDLASTQVWVCRSFEEAIVRIQSRNMIQNDIHKIFIIGGQKIYETALQTGLCQVVHATEIFKHYDCDTFFPALDETQFERKVVHTTQDFQCVQWLKRLKK